MSGIVYEFVAERVLRVWKDQRNYVTRNGARSERLRCFGSSPIEPVNYQTAVLLLAKGNSRFVPIFAGGVFDVKFEERTVELFLDLRPSRCGFSQRRPADVPRSDEVTEYTIGNVFERSLRGSGY